MDSFTQYFASRSLPVPLPAELLSVYWALAEIKSGMINSREAGICWNLSARGAHSQTAFHTVCALAQDWGQWSGKVNFPIYPYLPGVDKWADEQGKMRFDLIEHIRAHLTQIIISACQQ